MQDLNDKENARRDREFRVMLTSALVRPMGGIIIAVTIIIGAFVNVWFIPLGLAFYAASVYSSLQDADFNKQAVNDALYPEKDVEIGRLRGNYRAIMQQALDQKERIKQAVNTTGSDVIRGSLATATASVDDVTTMIYEICYKAQQLESYLSNVDIGRVRNEVSTMKARMALSTAQETQFDDTLKLKQEQLANLSEVDNTLRDWQAQLGQALASLDTIYSQVLRIKSADVMNMTTATDEVERNLNSQVSQLRNMANAYDAVLKGKV